MMSAQPGQFCASTTCPHDFPHPVGGRSSLGYRTDYRGDGRRFHFCEDSAEYARLAEAQEPAR